MMLILQGRVYSSEARVVEQGRERHFLELEESYVYTHMLTGGRVGWLRGQEMGNGRP